MRSLLRLGAARRNLRFFAAGAEAPAFRILAPTAILGYGFPRASFDAALSEKPMDLIAVDAGSVDPGPYYLATRSSFTSLAHVIRDLRIMVEGFWQQRNEQGYPCKLVVGSAGGCGTNNQVDILTKEVLTMIQEIGGQAATVATVTSEVTDPSILEGRQLSPLGPMPGLGSPSIAAGSVVVAQMGLEPLMCALEHADIIICGRAYDPAVFAAEPVRRGYPAAMALHAAKVLECGAIACVPGSGSDCLVAELTLDGKAKFWAPNKARSATPLSVAAHTLYEKSHPHCFGLPSGVLNTTRTQFVEKEGFLEVHGTALSRVAPAVKLEGAAVRGHRAVGLSLLPPGKEMPQTEALRFVYGIDGVESRSLEKEVGEQELGLLVCVSGGPLARNKAHLALLRATLLHFGFEGRKSTAGNLAFPFSPSDLLAPNDEVVTVCGTRDPAFIANYKKILRDVEAYVATLSDADGLVVRFFPTGLPGLQKLAVEETVASSAEDALTALGSSKAAGVEQRWVCTGGLAADYTVHHLVDMDEELTRSLFKIQVVSSAASPEDSRELEAKLLPWGSGPVFSQAEAHADWPLSRKPRGIATLGRPLSQVAKVIRSKNAGVNELTYDVIFDNQASYDAVKQSPALDDEKVEALLGRSVLGVYCDDTSLAIKITCDRGLLAGSAGDRDVYGAQQQRRLVDLVV